MVALFYLRIFSLANDICSSRHFSPSPSPKDTLLPSSRYYTPISPWFTVLFSLLPNTIFTVHRPRQTHREKCYAKGGLHAGDGNLAQISKEKQPNTGYIDTLTSSFFSCSLSSPLLLFFSRLYHPPPADRIKAMTHSVTSNSSRRCVTPTWEPGHQRTTMRPGLLSSTGLSLASSSSAALRT